MAQNWTVAQDHRGVIYVGSKAGVSIFDGESWELFELNSTVRSLAAGANGDIFVGLQGDFGFLRPNRDGRLSFHSLVPVDSDFPAFNDVWSVHLLAFRNLVVFQASSHLFLWDGAIIKVIGSEGGFHTSFAVAGRLFVRDRLRGLLELVEDVLQDVPGGDMFVSSKIYSMIAYDQKQILIATREGDFFLLGSSGLRRFYTSASRIFSEAPIYGGVSLSKDEIALATFGEGVVIIDRAGNVVTKIGPNGGLGDSVINGLFLDRFAGLWVATNNAGIYRVDYPTPLTKFNEASGLEGVIYDLASIGTDLAVATGSGLYLSSTDRQPGVRIRFDEVAGIQQSWSVASVEGVAIVASENGLYRVSQGRDAALIDEGSYYSLSTSTSVSGRVFAGKRNALKILDFDSGDLVVVGEFDVDAGEIGSIVELNPTTLLLGSRQKGALGLGFVGDGATATITDLGLPDRHYWVSRLLGNVVAASTEAIYFFETPKGYGVPKLDLGDKLPFDASQAGLLTFDVSSDADRTWFVFRDSSSVVYDRAEHDRALYTPPLLRGQRSEIARILVEDSGVAWISRGDELYRYDPHVVKDYDIPYPALVRAVLDARTDSVLFGGSFRNANGSIGSTQLSSDVPKFAYEFNNLRFRFAAPTFNSPGKTLYQHRLGGKDKNWSEWSRTTSVSYSGLTEGSYTLEVRAKNGFGYLSTPGYYSFHVLPPWYRTWWAYATYLIGCLTLATLSWKYVTMLKAQRAARHQARELARERVINERLNEANEQLHTANLRLTEVNSLKDEFLATTSHELRTPITAILGYASILREEIPNDYLEFVDIIEKSGVRLMSTLNSLLDLAELRAGTVELVMQPVDLDDVLRESVNAFQSDAADRGLYLKHEEANQPVTIETDRIGVVKVVNSLIGNAVKFTDEGGVTVAAYLRPTEARIKVSDTGVGIEASFLPALFDEFRQESDGLSRSHAGNGLGLAIAGKLIELLGGSVEVESQKGIGTTFTVILPLRSQAHDPVVDDADPESGLTIGSKTARIDRPAASSRAGDPSLPQATVKDDDRELEDFS